MNDIVIISLGARTPVGLTAESAAAAIRAGISRIAAHPFLADPRGEPLVTARDARLDADILGWRRFPPLATSALLEAVGKVFPDPAQRPSLTALVVLPELRSGFSATDAQHVATVIQSSLQAKGFTGRVETTVEGHAGGLHAIARAGERLARGESEAVAVVGVDSYLDLDTLQALAENKRLAGEGVRGGFHPGEGAGCVILALGATARRYTLPPLAKVRGAGASMEERAVGKGVEVLGQGLAGAFEDAARGLRLPHETIDAVFCDINGERYRSEEWGMAVLRLPTLFGTTVYDAPANLWGDMGAAWGPLGCVLAVRSWARDYAKGPRALIWGSSDGGLRAAVILEQSAIA